MISNFWYGKNFRISTQSHGQGSNFEPQAMRIAFQLNTWHHRRCSASWWPEVSQICTHYCAHISLCALYSCKQEIMNNSSNYISRCRHLSHSMRPTTTRNTIFQDLNFSRTRRERERVDLIFVYWIRVIWRWRETIQIGSYFFNQRRGLFAIVNSLTLLVNNDGNGRREGEIDSRCSHHQERTSGKEEWGGKGRRLPSLGHLKRVGSD